MRNILIIVIISIRNSDTRKRHIPKHKIFTDTYRHTHTHRPQKWCRCYYFSILILRGLRFSFVLDQTGIQYGFEDIVSIVDTYFAHASQKRSNVPYTRNIESTIQGTIRGEHTGVNFLIRNIMKVYSSISLAIVTYMDCAYIYRCKNI